MVLRKDGLPACASHIDHNSSINLAYILLDIAATRLDRGKRAPVLYRFGTVGIVDRKRNHCVDEQIILGYDKLTNLDVLMR